MAIHERTRRDDLWFRLGTGAFALVLVLIVIGIGVELLRQSHLSIARVRMAVLADRYLGPCSAEFGARPFIWGTLYPRHWR